MTNHQCVICTKPMESEAMACRPCGNRLDSTLLDIQTLHAELPDQLERGQSNGQRVSGSREAPLPLRVDPLDLSLGAPSGRQRWSTVTDPFGDQGGHQSVLTILDSWVRDWRDTRNKGESLPLPAGPSMVSWLRNRLDWACQEHGAIDEFDQEMRQLRSALRAVVGTTDTRPEFLDAPCRKCEWRSLVNRPSYITEPGGEPPGTDRIECDHCGDISTMEEYRRWQGLLIAGIQDGAVPTPSETLFDTLEAATFARVKPDLIRQ